MIIYIGADHRGFKLKEKLRDFLKERGYPVFDLGADSYEASDDYPDFAHAVAKKVAEAPEDSRGILICGTGAGVDIVANKVRGVRSVLASNIVQATRSKNDDNTNVISLGAELLTEEEAESILMAWLDASFSGEDRHVRRLKKIGDIESGA